MSRHPGSSIQAAVEPTTHAVPGRLITLGLLGGRAAFRGLWMLAPLLLATTWSAHTLGSTLAAIGTFGWVTLLLGSTEKTLLKQVPRLRLLGGQIVRTALGLVIGALLVTILIAVALTALDAAHEMLAWGLAWACAGALFGVVASLQRLAGHITTDLVLFGFAGLWVLLVTGATVLLDWGPHGWLLTIIGGLTCVSLVSLTRLPTRWLRSPHRDSVTRPVLLSLLGLGLPEVLSFAGVSAGFFALGTFGDPREATRFYVAATAAGVFGAVTTYLVRLRQPATSMRLRGAGARNGEQSARRLLDRAILCGLIALAAALLLVVLDLPRWVGLGALTLAEILVFTQRTVAANLIENARSRWLPGNAAAAGLGLLSALVVLALWARSGGAEAAMAALVVAQLVNSTALRALLHTATERRP